MDLPERRPLISEFRNSETGNMSPSGAALFDLLTSILQYDPAKRASLQDILAHRWLTQSV